MADTCVMCGGTGYVKRGQVYGFKGNSEDHSYTLCPKCNPKEPCPACGTLVPRRQVGLLTGKEN